MQTFNCTKLYLLGFCVDHPKCCIYTNKIGRIRTMGGMVCTAIEIPRQSINFNSMKDRWIFFSIHLSVSTHLFFWAIRTQQKSDKNVYLFHCCRGGSEFQSLFLSLSFFFFLACDTIRHWIIACNQLFEPCTITEQLKAIPAKEVEKCRIKTKQKKKEKYKSYKTEFILLPFIKCVYAGSLYMLCVFFFLFSLCHGQ